MVGPVIAAVVAGCVPAGGLSPGPSADGTAIAPTPFPPANTLGTTPGDAIPSAEPEPEPEKAAPDGALVLGRGYLAALASAVPSRQQEAIRATAAGSPARAYATFQVAQARAMREQDLEPTEGELRVSPGEVTLCHGATCAAYRDFRAEGEPPRLVSFAIAGIPVDDRVVTDAAPTNVPLGPARVDLVGALQAATEDTTLVALEIRNGAATLDLPLFLSGYDPPDAPSRTVVDAIGPVELAPNVTATVILVFERAAFGGTVRLVASTGDAENTAELRLPTT